MTTAAQAGNWSLEAKAEAVREKGNLWRNFRAALFQPRASAFGDFSIYVYDAASGLAMPRATVLLGVGSDSPFRGNQTLTAAAEFSSQFTSQTAIQNVKHLSTYRNKLLKRHNVFG